MKDHTRIPKHTNTSPAVNGANFFAPYLFPFPVQRPNCFDFEKQPDVDIPRRHPPNELDDDFGNPNPDGDPTLDIS